MWNNMALIVLFPRCRERRRKLLLLVNSFAVGLFCNIGPLLAPKVIYAYGPDHFKYRAFMN